MNEHLEEALKKWEAEKLVALSNIQVWMDEEMHDEDGYPTESALKIVETWPYGHKTKEYFEFIKSIWWSADWGWSEGEEPHEYKEDTKVYRYNISTGGWSGNESIIRVMQKNNMMWWLNWVQSRRGGHYIFELRELE